MWFYYIYNKNHKGWMVVEFKGESLTCSKSLPNELSKNFLETLEFTTMLSEAIPRPTVVVKNNC
jgi:hypothetical protein